MPIVKYGDKVLVTPAEPLREITPDLGKLIADMFETMYAEPGIGLAANQVGVGLRLVVIDVGTGEKSQPMVLINPKIDFASRKKVKEEEGCLSFPQIFLEIERPEKVKVSAVNEKGLPVLVEGEGLLGRCLQHEIDHINGVVFLDRVSPWKRWKAKQEIKKRKKEGTW